MSGVSGLDDVADSRGFALLDLDRDGWLDIVLANENTPRLRLFRNAMGDGPDGLDNRFVAFRFVGGNTTEQPSTEWSTRDGFGTSVELELADEVTLYREHQTESSFGAQNSTTMVVGLGTEDVARAATVRWLSGKVLETSNIPAGTLVTVYEDPSASPTGESFMLEPYQVDPARMTRLPGADQWRAGLFPAVPSRSRFAVEDTGNGGPPARSTLMLHTTMATWCVACVTEMPEFNHLREVFTENELGLLGLPVDRNDTAELLGRWEERYTPPYDLLIGLPSNEVNKVSQVVLDELRLAGDEAVPAAIVTDGDGRVLLARWGVPTVSTLKRLLSLVEARE